MRNKEKVTGMRSLEEKDEEPVRNANSQSSIHSSGLRVITWGIYPEFTFLASTPDLFNQNLWGWGLRFLNRLLHDSFAELILRQLHLTDGSQTMGYLLLGDCSVVTRESMYI